jgi:predicted PurR-regulated permease PerM
METVVLVSLVLLTGILVAVGIWLILVLNEARQVLRRLNQTTEAFENLVAKLDNSGNAISGLVEGVSYGVKLVESLQRLVKKKKDGK